MERRRRGYRGDMPLRHRRIVRLENAVRQALGLPVLGRPTMARYAYTSVPISDSASIATHQVSSRLRIAYEILGEAVSHGSSSTSGTASVVRGRIGVRERFNTQATSLSVGALIGSTFWAVVEQEGPFGAVVGGALGWGYGVWLSRQPD